ncbi:hypothetical protein C7B76_28060 [filamentous cyanobacterium CCP2]|nr:hypothetical protein C7B76_28060 [filamentous cyanobacterium CCP2]
MKPDLYRIQQTLSKHPDRIICLLIFVTCIFVYQSNGRFFLGSNDNVPHTLLAFNWLENQTLNFDNFRDGYLFGGDRPYFFAEGINGQLTSRYPIGTSLISFPLYIIFYLYLKLASLIETITSGVSSDLLDVASQDFSDYRQTFSKLAGTLSTAFSAVLFYLSVRLKFNRLVSSIATFTFAFATASWALNSQDLRQHTISNLVLITIILCLFKADRTEGKNQRILLFLAGIFSGLLPGVRITSGIFSAAAFFYSLLVFRKESVFFLLGLPSALISFAWNAYFFGVDNMITGGYVSQLEIRPSPYKFELGHFLQAFFGMTISPSEGFFVYSPVLLFAFPGAYQVFKKRSNHDEHLLLWMTLASIGLFIHFCFYGSWMGGSGSYGSRFLTDVIPVVSFLVAYPLASIVRRLTEQPNPVTKAVFTTFLVSLLISTLIQAIGVFSNTDWGMSPIPLGTDRSRVWHITDSRIERHTKNLFARITRPIKDPEQYVQGMDGRVEQMEMAAGRSPFAPIDGSPIELMTRQRRVFRATLTNTGTSQWYGYQSGMVGMGEAKLRVQFINREGNNPKPMLGRWLNVSGTTKPGEQTTAIGRVTFPNRPGQYEMQFSVFAAGLNNELNQSKPPIYTMDVTVLPRDGEQPSEAELEQLEEERE